MLDIMEIRGFEVKQYPPSDDIFLVTPDKLHFTVMRFPHLSIIACVFACFESINSNYK